MTFEPRAWPRIGAARRRITNRARLLAENALRWTLHRRVVRQRVPLARWYAMAMDRSPDRAEIGAESIIQLKALVPLTGVEIVSNYFDGLLPYCRYDEPERYAWEGLPSRGLILPDSARLPRTAKRRLKQTDLEIRFDDEDVERIIRACRRPAGTWLHEPLIQGLLEAAELGFCTAVGGYRAGELVAGEFGLDIAGWYASMSTFHTDPNSGSILLSAIVSEVMSGGRFRIVDVGEMKEHSRQFGAVDIIEADFRERLVRHLSAAVSAAGPSTTDS